MNTYFQFKQFIIHQEKTAMKVCTDACLFGAWVAEKLEHKQIEAKNILDIGCGTGLLSLMLAQKSEASMDAVEINENAFLQGQENISISKWKERISIFHENIIDYNSKKKYDLIICNPPFFENQLKSDDEQRNIAMHATQLSIRKLASSVKNNLEVNGIAAILLPSNTVNNVVAIFKKENLHLIEQLNISHSPTHPLFRTVVLYSFEEKKTLTYSIAIKEKGNDYSLDFKKLLADYYLHL